ncbi:MULTISPECIES: beta-N-acetylhexosaminidase [unclassified Meiothermus]|uniref:beta-N-acetylhexosaminidase n=1 Tax=unclassified Meiothermus TaxID=370471 RepID=UPI000D7BE49F|nr:MULTISPECIES: beta-N-acetylhexosaminidase [unclassified Meiothermus]PZA06287.1 beta-N-acetylhexosaminidase [Meiothermus sp. Pnk-1]RYM36386.1 beta-N-acetylhexosaminidase [Meiothermus sp. PNK-Is4]
MKKYSTKFCPLVVDIPGPTLDDATRHHLAHYGFAGVCLFRKNIRNRHQLAQLVAELREILGPEALIAIDQEGGAVLRTTDLPEAPSAMAMGATGDPALAQAVGAAVGRGLISLGINWDYAPVLDVNTDPRNPVIGDRSFGSDPAKVAELGLAWARGLEGTGVMACVKHFPGHGDTSLDSHLALPVVRKPREQLEAVEFYPFRRAVEARISSIMTAHILYPALDPEYPATLSQAILTGLLREEWGYDGLVVTDSMDMKAITHFSPDAKAAAVRAFIAGADLVLALGSRETQQTQAEALRQAREGGTIPAQRWEKSQQRLEQATARFPGTPRPYSSTLEAEDRAILTAAARRSITRYGEVRLPHPGERILFVAPDLAPGESAYENGPAAQELARRLAERFPGLKILAYPRSKPEAIREGLQAALQEADFILYVTTSRQPLQPGELELARALFSSGRPALHVALWNPYHVMALGQPALITYGWRQPTLEALIEALSGAEAPGKLPVELAE